jgi:hypothetical protein
MVKKHSQGLFQLPNRAYLMITLFFGYILSDRKRKKQAHASDNTEFSYEAGAPGSNVTKMKHTILYRAERASPAELSSDHKYPPLRHRLVVRNNIRNTGSAVAFERAARVTIGCQTPARGGRRTISIQDYSGTDLLTDLKRSHIHSDVVKKIGSTLTLFNNSKSDIFLFKTFCH